MKIDRLNSIPIYKQLRLILQDHILMGEWVPGYLLPTEQELCEEYDISRITVRKALEDLARKGLIERIQGKGSIVVDRRKTSATQHVRGFTEETLLAGSVPSIKLLNKELIYGDSEINTLLRPGQVDDEPIWRFRRLCSVDGKPAVLMNNYVQKKMGDKMLEYDLDGKSFYSIYAKIINSPILYSENVITAVSASPEIAQILQVEPDSAQIWFRGVAYIEGGIPIEVNRSVFRADLYEFATTFYRPRGEDAGNIPY